MYPVIVYFLSSLAKFLLWLFDWQPITDEFVEEFLRHPRKIVIFPHSTYWDFPIFATYGMTKWLDYETKVYAVMKPQLVDGIFGCFFRSFNCIAATRRDQTGGGFIERTGLQFANDSSFTILIAPEGTTKRVEWRTGYFYLAQQLNCPIQVMGLDYHRRCAVIKDIVMPTDLLTTEKHLKEIVATIPTLNPENSVVPSPQVKTSLYRWRNIVECFIWIILTYELLFDPIRALFFASMFIIIHLQY